MGVSMGCQVLLIMGNVKNESGPWIRRFHPTDDSDATLVCFPHAGGSATYFFPVSRSLTPGTAVLAVQYPGRQDRRTEEFIDDIGALADAIAEELRPWCDRPVALFGHSMGAIVAYEVGRRLEATGVSPMGLLASGRRAPASVGVETVHLRDDNGIVAALKELSGTDSAVLGDEELLRMILPAVRSDYRAVESYCHQGGPELLCPITVLVGESDPVTSLDQARAWREHTTGAYRLEVFSGGHFYLNTQVESVALTIRRQMGDWLAGS